MALACCVFPEFAILSQFQVKKHEIWCCFLVCVHRPLKFCQKFGYVPKINKTVSEPEKLRSQVLQLAAEAKTPSGGLSSPLWLFPDFLTIFKKIRPGDIFWAQYDLIWAKNDWITRIWKLVTNGHLWPPRTSGPCPGGPRDPKIQSPLPSWSP